MNIMHSMAVLLSVKKPRELEISPHFFKRELISPLGSNRKPHMMEIATMEVTTGM